mmetsp:Transcript_8789/g.21333  ORF Transcript_8789/g.21333 Transcript_8789/m.21333 type:complete len:655 (+) Transcript_8789:61-2025(+)
MKAIVSVLAAATFIRLFLAYAFSTVDSISFDDDILSQALGPGILPAIGAAILDPVHTWDHLQEACFWLENTPSLWKESRDGRGSKKNAGYSAIYMPGTRIVAPPLVVAFLGETLVCPDVAYLGVIRTLMLLIADGIGAYCIYHMGKRIFETESMSNEAEMERHTALSGSEKDVDDDLVVPGILRPERGWIVGLSSKIVPPEECSTHGHGSLNENENGASADDKQQTCGSKNDKSTENTATTISTLPTREPIIAMGQLPIVTCVVYYCNPISMFANATGSMRSLWDALMLLSLYYSTMPPTSLSKEGIRIKDPSATKTAISLAFATYADTGYAVFLLPILLWRGLFRFARSPAIQKAQHNDWKLLLALYVFYLAGLHYFSSLLVGGVYSVYIKVIVQTMLPNIAFVQQDGSGSVPGPSMGLHWYLFVQMFDRFRPYFTVFVSGIPAMFFIPLAIRLHRYPSVLVATFQLLWAIHRPTATVHTLALGLHLALLNPRTIVRMRTQSLISFCALPVPVLLFVTFHRMWLVTGNGNPNYIYFQCFAYGMFVTIISMEFVSATVKRDKVRRMVEKGSIKKILLAKEKDGSQKEAANIEGHNVVEKKAETVKAHDSIGEDNATMHNGIVGMREKATEDDGRISDQMDDAADDKPEPVVVFL